MSEFKRRNHSLDFMEVVCLGVGRLGTNCYIVYDGVKKTGIIIDPGADADIIVSRALSLDITIEYILFTHAHFDHIMAYPGIKRHFDKAKPVIALKEKVVLSDSGKNMLPRGSEVSDLIMKDAVFVSDGARIEFGDGYLTVLETPGHTAGSICLAGDGILFSGDTLFQYSIGRCDLPTGSLRDEIFSVVNILFKLDPETKVYPGHGPATTIGFEKENNEVYNWIE